MKSIFDWVKSNKLVILLLVAVGYLIFRDRVILPLGGTRMGVGIASVDMIQSVLPKVGDSQMALRGDFVPPYPGQELPPTTGIDRMVITDTTLSVVVTDVSAAINTVPQPAES